ncbi:hypothetical protein BDV29DRAFT_184953 [Aspergillus leporis]|uniref:Cytochrome P450 n=1 Tax=Aspergillus leporis TaxID=41062 RepID=A0A5N5WMG3_9EURO|nr:hypothetical protein BDV29DRAFT_184953 [Aspergillus leporis]
MYWLLKSPEYLTRLRKEVDAALNPQGIAAPCEKVKSLPYLPACLEEGLRIIPPFTFNCLAAHAGRCGYTWKLYLRHNYSVDLILRCAS